MNFKKVLAVFMIGVLCISLFSGCGGEAGKENVTTTVQPNATAGKTIVVAGQNENLGFWQNVKKGAEEAAKKYGYTLTYIGTDEDNPQDISTHVSIIGKVIDKDISGFVVAPLGEGYSQVLSKLYDKSVPVVQIDTIVDDDVEKLEANRKNPIVSTVSTSYEDAGAMCAEKLFEAVKESIEKSENTYVIGVLVREDNEADESKAKGFTEKFSELADADSAVKDKYKIEKESGNKYVENFGELIEDNAKAIFLTHSDISDKISDTVFADSQKYKDVVFCGFESGAKQIKWLDSESAHQFIGGVVQNPYELGYNAVEQCVFAIEGKDVKTEVKVEGQWYDKNNVDKMKQDNMVFEK
ncbi:MAG: substrate-binding domain-containing protein [Acutalibacteraceae bacterium]